MCALLISGGPSPKKKMKSDEELVWGLCEDIFLNCDDTPALPPLAPKAQESKKEQLQWVIADALDTSSLDRIPSERLGCNGDRQTATETTWLGLDLPPIQPGQGYYVSTTGEIIVGYGHTTDPPRNSEGKCQLFGTDNPPNSTAASEANGSKRKRKRKAGAASPDEPATTKRTHRVRCPVCKEEQSSEPGSALGMEFVWKCAHSVCRGCLEQMNSHGVSHQCPVCRTGWA